MVQEPCLTKQAAAQAIAAELQMLYAIHRDRTTVFPYSWSVVLHSSSGSGSLAAVTSKACDVDEPPLEPCKNGGSLKGTAEVLAHGTVIVIDYVLFWSGADEPYYGSENIEPFARASISCANKEPTAGKPQDLAAIAVCIAVKMARLFNGPNRGVAVLAERSTLASPRGHLYYLGRLSSNVVDQNDRKGKRPAEEGIKIMVILLPRFIPM